MNYTSLVYYFFLIVLLVIYYLLPMKYRWISLLAASIIFYYSVIDRKMQLIVFGSSIIISWFFGIILYNLKNYYDSTTIVRKIVLGTGIVLSTLPLLISKVGGGFLCSVLEKNLNAWVIPVGLSFYSMQIIAYLADIYSGKIKAQRNPFKYALFISFFPQIIQGPIPRYSQLSDQLLKGRRFDAEIFVKGFMLIIWGFFLKLCIADKAGIVVNRVFDSFPTYQGIYVIIAGVLYSIQLYADFLSCTSLAQGVSNLFGINLVDNFMHPYFAVSVKDFWRRWHISLSSWLRDYVYIPLGGNRKGTFRKHIHMLLTFAVSGIWHGNGYKYLFWGLLHGLYQVIGDCIKPVKEKVRATLKIRRDQIFSPTIHRTITYILVMLAWIIFRADCLKTGISMICSIVTVHNPWILTNDALYSLGLDWKEFHLLLFCIIVLLLVSAVQENGINIRDRVLEKNICVRWAIYIGVILFIVIFGTYGYGYDAQAFIYGGF